MSSQEESRVRPGARLTADLRAFSVTRMEQYNFDTLREEEKRGGSVQRDSNNDNTGHTP